MNYKNINLDKNMYAHPTKSFSEILEELDPSAEYAGTELEGLDAFQRQLKRFDIKVAGAGSDSVQKFFAATNSSALFPEYVTRAVRQGMNQNNCVTNIVAATTVVPTMDYRTMVTSPLSLNDESIAEGGAIPKSTVRTQNNLVDMKKHGSLLVSSYEALKFQRIDLLSVTLRQIGANIARQQIRDAVDVIINGDGNNNPAEVVATSGSTLTYADVIALWNSLDPYNMNKIIVSNDVMTMLLGIEEFKNPLTGLNFQATGELTTPLGAELIRSSAIPSGTFIGLDKNCALELVRTGEVTVEYDKLIDRQLERAAITSITGFAKIFEGASKVLSV